MFCHTRLLLSVTFLQFILFCPVRLSSGHVLLTVVSSLLEAEECPLFHGCLVPQQQHAHGAAPSKTDKLLLIFMGMWPGLRRLKSARVLYSWTRHIWTDCAFLMCFPEYDLWNEEGYCHVGLSGTSGAFLFYFYFMKSTSELQRAVSGWCWRRQGHCPKAVLGMKVGQLPGARLQWGDEQRPLLVLAGGFRVTES